MEFDGHLADSAPTRAHALAVSGASDAMPLGRSLPLIAPTMRGLAVCALIANLSSSPAASASELDIVVARHVAWRGGVTFQTLRSTERTGEIKSAGLTGSISQLERRDGYRRIDYDLKVIEGSESVTPSDAWTTSGSGQIEDLGESLTRDARRALASDYGLLLGSDSMAQRSLLGMEERDRRSWQVVRAAFADGGYYDYFLDPASGALAWVRYTRDADVVWVRYGDWRLANGVLMPFTEEQVFPNADENTSITWRETSVDFVTDLPSARFARPAGRRVSRILGGAESTGWTKFDFYHERRVFLPVTVNGVSTTAILDSGAEYSALDAAFAQRAGIAGGGTFAAQGSGGDAQISVAKGIEIRVGALELRNLTVAVLDLSGLSRQIGAPLPVILGKELFNEMIVEIDYPRRRIAFHDPANWSYRGLGTRVPLEKDRGLRKVRVSVEGLAPIKVGFDLGQGSALSLYREYAEKEKLLEGRKPLSKLRGGGVGGATSDVVGTLKSVAFGGTQFTDVPATFVLDPAGSTETKSEQGNLGAEVFKRFRLVIDYTRDALYLEPDQRALREPFSKDRSGLDVEMEGASLVVAFVAPGSPAEKAGWKVGEEIVAIDGKAVGIDYWTSDRWRWCNGRPGKRVALTMRGGGTRVLTLADYY